MQGFASRPQQPDASTVVGYAQSMHKHKTKKGDHVMLINMVTIQNHILHS